MRIINTINKYGIVGTFRKFLQRFLGIQQQQEAIDSLYYYLNNYLITASELPPTKDPELRIMQKCDAELLRILDNICKKHNLTYWLDFGTLLGAYRHKGFIPWDDDMDVSMIRKDYEKFVSILKSELADSNFNIEESDGRIGFGYKHEKTGIWCDIFPVDFYKVEEYSETNIEILKSKISQYRSFYIKNKEKLSSAKMQENRRKIINENPNANSVIVYHGREFNHQHPRAFYCVDEIFPLSNITFENMNFPAPIKCDLYLSKIFGKNYMQVPKGGILHHGENRGALSTWAIKNKINMDVIFQTLSEIK